MIGAITRTARKNERNSRALEALLSRPHSREEMDCAVGASNSPDVVMRIKRDLGIEIVCRKVERRDRDGQACHPGIYSLTLAGRDAAIKWLGQGVFR